MSLLVVVATLYYIAVIVAAARFGGRSGRAPEKPPPISILKPLRGADPRLLDNLRSHLALDYPDFEILCGIAHPDDPAVAVMEELGSARFLRPIVCGPPGDGNAKVAILEKLAAEARHDTLLVNDADIRLEPGDLAALAAELTPNVGLVTTLYRARPGGTSASRLDAAWISGDFAGQALVGAKLAGLSFALGATMLFRRGDLEMIGGFGAIRPYLADDYQLGARIAALGKPVRLSNVLVETILGDPGWREVWLRHLRWSRTIRASRPGGHLGFGVTFGCLWALLLLAAGGPGWLAALAVAGRMAASFSVAAALGASATATALVAPLAELWSAAVWLWSFTGREVVWAGRRLRLDRSGIIAESRD
jgi:ceramide glucosyltransferase